MPKRVIALGFFDGVHLGHGALLKKAALISTKSGLKSAALTYTRHPSDLLSNNPIPLINTTQERVDLIRSLYGIDEVLLKDFDDKLMHLGCEDFVKHTLCEELNAAHIVVGYDYRFGFRATGDAAMLSVLCAQYGIGCDIIDKVELDGIVVSSTYIRGLISNGDMVTAARFLGHPHIMEGVVREGAQLGRTIGIPTINLHFEKKIQIPKHGVYITRVTADGAVYRGVTNIGIRPTVSDKNIVKAETHIMDFTGNLYGKQVRIEFSSYLREEKRFNSVDDLKAQINHDILSACKYMEN